MPTVNDQQNIKGAAHSKPQPPGSPYAVSRNQYDAVVLDLDGVVTHTAEQHARAWKSVFDEYLAYHAPDQCFDLISDYRQYVDGKPRYEGVRSFLESRGIHLPRGEPSDAPDRETICGLGNRKNKYFLELLSTSGVTVFPESLSFIQALRRAGFAVAVASSSRNCQEVLEAAGIEDLFDARVDGVDLEQLHLEGKPAPDMFLEACDQLHASAERSIGIEDAESGIQALNAAKFGRVIGVGDEEREALFRQQGADLVVRNLGELEVEERGS